MRSFLALVFIILTLASPVTGFRSATLPQIHRKMSSLGLGNRLATHRGTAIVYQQNVATTDELDGEEPEVVIQIEDLSLSQVAELIEVSFIQACMQLSQGYVDVLKLFIVSVKSAYQRCSSYNSMKDIVSMVDSCPTNTAGRPLAMEEIQLRTTWIYAVALMLDHIDHRTTSSTASESVTNQRTDDTTDDIAKTVQNTYEPILSTVVDLNKNGDKLKTQEFMNQNKHLLPDNVFDDDVQLAIASQTVKVLYYTLTVLEDERLANDNDEMSSVARPQIPRGDSVN